MTNEELDELEQVAQKERGRDLCPDLAIGTLQLIVDYKKLRSDAQILQQLPPLDVEY